MIRMDLEWDICKFGVCLVCVYLSRRLFLCCCCGQVKDNQVKIKHWTAELKKLKLEKTGVEDGDEDLTLPVCILLRYTLATNKLNVHQYPTLPPPAMCIIIFSHRQQY